MKTSLVAQASPFKQEMLSPSECFILDNGVDNKIFLWKGTVRKDEHSSSSNTLADMMSEQAKSTVKFFSWLFASYVYSKTRSDWLSF